MIERLARWDAPASDWTLRVVLHRIATYDGHRTAAIRLALWVALLALFLYDLPAWWGWLLLIPGALHAPFEVAVRRAHVNGDGGNRLLQWAEETAQAGAGNNPITVPGAVSMIAVPAQLFAVVWALPIDGPLWVRPAALVIALLYLNSSVSTPMLDSAFYNPRNVGGAWIWARLLRALVGPLMTALVMVLCLPAAWPGINIIGVVLILCLPLALSYRVRSFDDALRAAEDTLAVERDGARQRFFDALHGQLTGPVKAASRLILNHDPPVTAELREMGLVLPLLVSDTREMVDEEAWVQQSGRTSMRESVQSLSARSQLRTRYTEDASMLDATNKHLALVTLANLIPNAAAAQRTLTGRGRGEELPPVGVRVVTLTSGTVSVSVSDAAPMVPPEFWCAPGTSLASLRARLRHLGGDLVQINDGGGKTIAATWRHAQGGMV